MIILTAFCLINFLTMPTTGDSLKSSESALNARTKQPMTGRLNFSIAFLITPDAQLVSDQVAYNKVLKNNQESIMARN